MSPNEKKAPTETSQAVNSLPSGGALTGIPEKNRLFIPVLLAIIAIPLLVHLIIIDVNPDEVPLIGLATYGDFFSQSKAFLLLIVTLLILVFGVLFRKTLFRKTDRIPLVYLIASGVFILFTLLSAVFSEYRSIAFWGVHDRAEGAVILCCYIILFLYSFSAYRTEKDTRHLITALGIAIVISSVIGLFQYIGHDLLFTDLGKALVISPWDYDKVTDLSSMSESGRLYGTFYHWNYAGSFAAITVPIFLVLALNAKSWRSRIVLGCVTLMALWILIGSTSRAGLIGVAVAFIFGLIVFAKIIIKHWKASLSCVAIVLVAIIGLNITSNGQLFARIPTLFSDIVSVFQSSEQTDYLSKLPVKDVSAQNNTAVIVTQNNDVLKATLNKDSFVFKDGNEQDVVMEQKDGAYRTTDKRFQKFSFNLVAMGLKSNSLGLSVNIDNQPQFFFRIGSGLNLQLTNSTGTVDIDSLESPPSVGFAGKERIGSARGYIWSRSIPMIPDNLLLGSGPDTFVLNFPQNDLLGKYWAYGTTNMLVDKPHNLYLQILLGEGGIALLAFLTIVLLYLFDSIRLYALKRTYRPNEILASAVCLGVVGYLGAGLFNDSVVSVAPVFWILLGVGIALNLKNRKEQLKDLSQKS